MMKSGDEGDKVKRREEKEKEQEEPNNLALSTQLASWTSQRPLFETNANPKWD
jgi:hypothetical protein